MFAREKFFLPLPGVYTKLFHDPSTREASINIVFPREGNSLAWNCRAGTMVGNVHVEKEGTRTKIERIVRDFGRSLLNVTDIAFSKASALRQKQYWYSLIKVFRYLRPSIIALLGREISFGWMIEIQNPK